MRMVPFLLVTGCFAQVELGGGTASDPDTDGDGLTDAQEAELGLDPASNDSDGDTFPDGDEVAANADPLDPDHHPYAGGWPIAACRTDIVETGNQVGDVAANFKLTDAFGDTVHLYDFCDRTVLLIYAAFW
ncbi:MAG: hypothetical protein H0V89_02345 [Deltaproteobacteria bacterium]|nr:hypothetical protein [Deltaproteobacteria bacterium]